MNLNGCVIEYSYDKLSKKCRSCINKEYCDHKSKEKHGVLSLPTQEPTTKVSIALTDLSNAMAAAGVSASEATDALIYFNESTKAFRKKNGGDLF